ncbi:MAG: enoyl-CoA hydratase/isomerase family protein [Chloroflexi bacterium]|nr:enoyl-CoA hydratase/isomerase family protein [Chloroflexota bacterium]MDA1145841.1 enoyl-CoA hydratase/isomerase family protein [Chloroflexota bacterium]
MSDDVLVTSIEDGIGRLRLNRADKRNAINEPLSRAIQAAMEQMDADDRVHVILIEGTDGAFCAGADMGEALAASEAGDRRFNPSHDAAARVASSEKPTIAKIDGPAYGAGALLACGCDLRVMSDRSRMRFPGSDYGLVVGAAALTALVGPVMAKELIFTSRVIDADEALKLGLANRVVPADAVEAEALALAQAVAAASPLAARWAKQVINAAATGGDAHGLEAQADLVLRGGADHMQRFSKATARVVGRSN